MDDTTRSDSYPSEWESDVVLSDGGTVLLRPVRPDDAERIDTLYQRLSDESIYLRFFTPMPHRSAAMLERRTEVDYHQHMQLVAVFGNDVLALARYDRTDDGDAEVAFTVRDDQHGRGLATLMLEHLAVIARRNGIERFVASVLPENRAMLGVFRDAGYVVSQRFGDGAIEVSFEIGPTPRSVAASLARERHAEARSMARLLAPRTVAVVGAGRDPGGVGHQVLRNLLDGEFTGTIYPVNNAATRVGGLKAFASLDEIDDTIDLVVAAVPAAAVPALVEPAARRHAHSLVVVSAGFAELGEQGRVAELELVRRARRLGIRLVGPNSVGVVNTHPDVRLNALSVPFAPSRGTVAVLSQSGALAIPLMSRIAAAGLGISSFVSVGNRADVSGNDLLQHWEDDTETHAILLYLETFGNPRKFARLARRITRSKPIIAVKTGRRRGDGADATIDALFRQAGVIRVDTLEQLFDTTKVMLHQPLPAGRRVAVVANSAAPAALTADACDAAGLELATISESTQAAIRALVPDRTRLVNPVEVGAQADIEAVVPVIEAVLADDAVDSVVLTFLAPFLADLTSVGAALDRLDRRKAIVACALGDAETPPVLGRRVSIPTFEFPENAAQALARSTSRAEWLARPQGTVAVLDDIDVERARSITDAAITRAGGPTHLDASASRALLEAFGIPVIPSRPVHTAEEAKAAAAELGPVVAIRADAPGITHPSDVGAVVLDVAVGDAGDVFEAVVRAGGCSAALVQPMVEPGVDVIAGTTFDDTFGPLVGFAVSGIAAELLADVAIHIVPLTDRDAAEMVRSCRTSPLLFGYRGRPAVATEALEAVLVRLGQLADALPEVETLYIDPLIVSSGGAAVAAVQVRCAPSRATIPAGLRRL